MPFPPTPSITPSNTPTPSITASQTPTNTPTETSCPGLTPTATSTIPITPTNTQTNTPTNTQTQTPTSTIGTTPSQTPSHTPTPSATVECLCFSSATVNVMEAGDITFNDCNGNPTIENFSVGDGQTYGDGTFCIQKDTNGGTASYTIVSYNDCCTTPPGDGIWTVSNYDCGLGTVNDVGINSNFMGSLPLGPSTFPLTSTLGGSRQNPNGVINGMNTIQVNHSTSLQGTGNCLAIYIYVNQISVPDYSYYTSSSSPISIINNVNLLTTDDVLVLVECYIGACP